MTPREIHHHVVLISLDTLRADRLGCYGDGRRATPHLDALSGESVLFLNAASPSTWTVPAHMSMLSGLHPSTHRCSSPTSGYPSRDIPFPLVFELLEGAGYDALAVTGGGFVDECFGFGRGESNFQVITSIGKALEAAVWHLSHAARTFTFLHTYMVHDFCRVPCHLDPLRFARSWVPGYDGFFPTDADLSPLLSALALAEHPPVLGQWDRTFVDALYLAAVQDADGALGHLFEELRRRNLWGSSTVIVTSDHGESLGEVHDGRQYWSHGGPPFQEQIRVPLLIKPAGHLRARLRPGVIEPWVSLVDLVPTVLDLAGASSASDSFDGRSLLGELAPGAERGRARLYFFQGLSASGRVDHPASAVLWNGRWKVFYEGDVRVRQCYHLAADRAQSEIGDQQDQLDRAELEAIKRAIVNQHERVAGRRPRSVMRTEAVSARGLVTAPAGAILDRIMRVEGLCTRFSIEALQRWARSAPRSGLVVELGTYRGRTAAALCEAVGDHRVVTIDDWSMATFGGSNEDTARCNLAGLGYSPRVLTGASHHVPDGIDEVALLFIDSTHEADVLGGELRSWWPLLRPDCIIALHDYEPSKFPTLVEAVDQTFRPPQWERLGVVDFLVGFRRRLE